MKRMNTTRPLEEIEGRIVQIQGQRVLLDHDLAVLYGVPVKALNQAVKRNARRFPADFVFRLSLAETRCFRRHVAISGNRNVRYRPYAFTEHGAIMAANILKCRKAEDASVAVVRAFVRLRQALGTHPELAVKLGALERRLDTHDEAIRDIMEAIRNLIDRPESLPRRRIGFHRPS